MAGDASDFAPKGVPNARQWFADYYRKMVEEGLRSAREEPLVPHKEAMEILRATIARHEKKRA